MLSLRPQLTLSRLRCSAVIQLQARAALAAVGQQKLCVQYSSLQGTLLSGSSSGALGASLITCVCLGEEILKGMKYILQKCHCTLTL